MPHVRNDGPTHSLESDVTVTILEVPDLLVQNPASGSLQDPSDTCNHAKHSRDYRAAGEGRDGINQAGGSGCYSPSAPITDHPPPFTQHNNNASRAQALKHPRPLLRGYRSNSGPSSFVVCGLTWDPNSHISREQQVKPSKEKVDIEEEGHRFAFCT